MSTAAIELHDVQKRLGKFQLGPISLNVPRGTIYGLIGPNGAGKTTTLDLLMGMGQLDAGDIRILGRDPQKEEVEIKRRTAYVSPDLSYAAWGTVDRALNFVSGFYPDWDHERCARLQTELGVHSSERVAALSFGTRMKLSLIMALSRNAELLLLDEPTLGLDAIARRQLFEELLAFMRHEDRSIFISSHHIADLERFADHAAIVDRGRLLTSGRMDQLVERYVQLRVRRHPALAKLSGVFVTKHDEEFALVLVDTSAIERAALPAAGIEVLGENSLTLEEIFLALVKPGDAPIAAPGAAS